MIINHSTLFYEKETFPGNIPGGNGPSQFLPDKPAQPGDIYKRSKGQQDNRQLAT